MCNKDTLKNKVLPHFKLENLSNHKLYINYSQSLMQENNNLSIFMINFILIYHCMKFIKAWRDVFY